MCRLSGVVGNLAFKDEALVKRMLMAGYWLGPDSTGVASVRRNGDVEIAKLPSHPLDLFDTNRFKKVLNGTQSLAFIGHNRAATRGSVNSYNSHPFHFGNIVGAHNGTLDFGSQYDLEKELGEKFGTDSAALICAIDRFGVEYTIPLCRGAWSLVWVNLKEGTINFLRNKERPLWYGFAKDFKRLFWASEWEMIDYATQGNYNEPPFVDNEGYKYFATKENTLYSWKIEEIVKAEKRPKALVKEVEGAKGFFPIGPSGQKNVHDPFNRRHDTESKQQEDFTEQWQKSAENRKNRKQSSSGTTSTTTSHGISNKRTEPKIVDVFGSDELPYAGGITWEEFAEIGQQGCAWCLEPVPFGTQGITVFKRGSHILCPNHSLRGPENVSRIVIPFKQAA